MRILVVDDTGAVRSFLGLMLQSSGYEVVFAEDGMVAKIRLEQDRGGDLVLTDTQMPGVDGLELVSWIKEFRPHLPVIINTGSVEADLLREIANSGADRWLQKPFSMTSLLDTIKQLLAPAKT